MKKRLFYLLSILIPIIVLTTIFYFKDVLSGKLSILLSDLWGQYYGLMTNFKRILEGNASIFYSFRVGFGQPFIATLAYYLASPINFLVYFFNNVQAFIVFIVLLKIGLCGLTMYTYLKYHFKKDGFILLAFSSCYALSTFIVANYFQIMWLDVYYLAPLVILGIDRFIEKDKFLLYGITLFLSVTVNYYIGYMVCLFSVLYFIYRLFLVKRNKKEILNKIIHFLIISFLFGMLSMFINFPNILSLTNIDRSQASSLYELILVFNTKIWDNLSKLYVANHSINRPINVYYTYYSFGVINMPLLYFYFINKNIIKREKILSFIFLFILCLSLFITPLNNVWHAFSPPIGFNYRYFFLFIIFIIYLCTKSFIKMEKRDIKHYLVLAILFLVLSIFVYIYGKVNLLSLYATNALFLLYLITIYLYSKSFSRDKFIIRIFLFLLIIAELYFNAHNIFVNTEFSYNKSLNGVAGEKAQILDYIKENDDSLFYRTEFYNSLFNDSILYNYYSASGWYSTIDGGNISFFKKIGYSHSNNTYLYNSMIVPDSLFGIKYYITNKDDHIYDKINTVQISEFESFLYGKYMMDVYIYKNPYALSLGYMIEDNEFSGFDCIAYNICQQQILSNMLNGYKPVYGVEEIEKVGENSFKFKIHNQDDIVLYFNSVEYSGTFTYDIYINDTFIETKNNFSNFNINLKNNDEIDTEVVISIKNIKGDVKIKEISLMYQSMDNFKNIYKELSKNQLEISSFKDGYIKGNINVSDSKKVLFTSIPYSDGWTAYVDGKKVSVEKLYNVFLGVKLEVGEHEIELVYKTPGIKTGVVLSSISLLLIVFYTYKKTKYKF